MQMTVLMANLERKPQDLRDRVEEECEQKRRNHQLQEDRRKTPRYELLIGHINIK